MGLIPSTENYFTLLWKRWQSTGQPTEEEKKWSKLNLYYPNRLKRVSLKWNEMWEGANLESFNKTCDKSEQKQGPTDSTPSFFAVVVGFFILGFIECQWHTAESNSFCKSRRFFCFGLAVLLDVWVSFGQYQSCGCESCTRRLKY